MLIVRLQDEGIVLRIIPFEETKYIITVFTGRHGVYSGMTARSIPIFTKVFGHWSSRTQSLGYWQLEDLSAVDISDYKFLKTLQLLTDLLCTALPERHPYPLIYDGVKNYQTTIQFVDLLFLILKETGYEFDGIIPDDQDDAVKLALNLLEHVIN